MLAELFWLKHHRFEAFPVAKAVFAMNSMAVVSSTLGTLLTILFLKFNWFEPVWRRDVLQMYVDRGNWDFKFKILFTHLNQLPIALFDLLVLKQTHHILPKVTPSLTSIIVFFSVFSFIYLNLVQANYRYSKKYPYPFLDVIMTSWEKVRKKERKKKKKN